MSGSNKKMDMALFALLLVLAAIFLVPIVLVLINSFKSSLFISSAPFSLPDKESFVGLENYLGGIRQSGFFAAIGRSVYITVVSVLTLAIAGGMTSWYLCRVKTRFTKIIYYTLVFGMIVPFQMVMYTTTLTVGRLGLSSFLAMPIVYLAFGAGLTVFVLSGFIKGIPRAVEEAALIDGCSPLRTFFSVVLPLLTPSLISVSVLNAMWIWNDYLLPYLVLGTDQRTIPVAIQLSMQGAYGATNLGGLMAMLVLAMIPIIIFYLFGQKYIIAGVSQGAVKG